MGMIHKLVKDNKTIFPATITDAVVHPRSGKSLTSMINIYNVSQLFPTEGMDGGNTYNLGVAVQVLGVHLADDEKRGGITITFISNETNKYVQYRLTSPNWSTNAEDWVSM